MGKKYSYFLVMVDHETGTFRTDEETFQAHFNEGTIFDGSTNEWEKVVGEVAVRDLELWNALGTALHNIPPFYPLKHAKKP
jgi:hypothetical protein